MKYRRAQRRERSSNGKISKIGELTLEVKLMTRNKGTEGKQEEGAMNQQKL